jgi:hypothetical protein
MKQIYLNSLFILEAELDAAVPKPQGLIQAPVAGVGCTALADHLRAVA